MRPRQRSESKEKRTSRRSTVEQHGVRRSQRESRVSSSKGSRGNRGRRPVTAEGKRRKRSTPTEDAKSNPIWGWFKSLFTGRVTGGDLSPEERRAVEDFSRHLGITLNQPELMRLALTHRSFLHHGGTKGRESNERLEYLGDSVLGLVCSEWLYKNRPHEHEGQLTKTKSLLVSKAILSRRALAMGLGRFVLLSHSEVESGGRQRLSILADTFEAVIGAIYLDQGMDAARQFITTWLINEAESILADRRHTTYKSLLQEYVQSNFRTHPVYRIRAENGPDHLKIFTVEVMIGSRLLGEGRGQNKKEAEQSAARDALDRVAAKAGARRNERTERGSGRSSEATAEATGERERRREGRRRRRDEEGTAVAGRESEPRDAQPREARAQDAEPPAGRERESRASRGDDEEGSERGRRPRRERGRRRDRSTDDARPERELVAEEATAEPPRRVARRSEAPAEEGRSEEPRGEEPRRREVEVPAAQVIEAPMTTPAAREAAPRPVRPAASAPAAPNEAAFGRLGKPATRGLHSAAARADLEAAKPRPGLSPSVAEAPVGTPTKKGLAKLATEELLRPIPVPQVEIRRSDEAVPAGAPRDRYSAAETGGDR